MEFEAVDVAVAAPMARLVTRRFPMTSSGDLVSHRQYLAELQRLVMSATHPFGHASLAAFDEGTGEAALVQALNATTMTERVSYNETMINQIFPSEEELYPNADALQRFET